jgi:ankyrin repeat protein
MKVARFIAAAIAIVSVSVLVAPAQESGTQDRALLQAVQESNPDAIKKAIQAGANVDAADTSGATALMQAAIYSDVVCMRLLLENGANPNAANQVGSTALMWSAGDPEKLRLLLAKGAAVNVVAKNGRTALAAAASHAGNIDGVRLLLARGADAKVKDARVLISAAVAGDETIVRALLEAGGNPSEPIPSGVTPLMMASRGAGVGSARLLLDAGAEVNAKSNRPTPTPRGFASLGELTALHTAAAFGNVQLVKLLLERGADIKAKDTRGMTPLMTAAASEFQNEDIVRILIAAGSDVNAKAEDGQTVASWAAKWGTTGVHKLLNQAFPTSALPKPVKLLDVPREASIVTAVEKTLALLQSSSTEYFSKSGCSGCHHQMLTGMAVGLARHRGLKVDESLAKEQIRTEVTALLAEREGLLQGVPVGGAPMSDSLVLVSLAEQDYPADSFSAALTHFLAGYQSADGSWRGPSVRQPIQYSPFSNTAYAIRALQAYAPVGRKAEYARRIERARVWLQSQKPVRNEEQVKRLLGLAWAGANQDTLRAAASRLRADQLPDGGWAQVPGFPSDAYATGQTLYALNQAGGMRSNDPVYLKGVSFLRRTQLEDGSWHVRSRSVKFQPYFESGFPHGDDQWISAAGSAWAAMALTLALEEPPGSR